jgi:hypothetical protein
LIKIFMEMRKCGLLGRWRLLLERSRGKHYRDS